MAEVTDGSFGDLLRRFRRACRVSQSELALEAGFSAVYIGMLERGQRQPPEATIQALARALTLTEDQIDRLRRATMPTSSPGAEPRADGRLPHALTSFVGRRREIAVVCEMLHDPGVRLVTLTGPGGVGKTRLAIEVARSLRMDVDDGVVFVPLQALSHPDSVPRAVADSLGVRPKPGTSISKLLCEYLSAKHLLLVVDNFEQVLPAAGIVGELLSVSPQLLALITSRVPLGLSGEHVFPVRPLSGPGPWPERRTEGLPSEAARQVRLEMVADVAESDAAKLFVDRARAADPGFALTHRNASQVGEICRLLDGLPLAIELAAARAHVFPLGMVIEQLRRPMRAPPGAFADTHPRHHSLHAAFEWSYELLDRPSQEVFAGLSVFAGGCSFETAAEVCTSGGDSSIEEAMAVLVDASLVQVVDSREGRRRFVTLEPIREFAAEKLGELGEEYATRQRHLALLVRLGEQFAVGFRGPDSEAWVARIDTEYANILAALDWSVDNDPINGLRLAAAMGTYWDVRGRVREGRRVLDSLLGATSGHAWATSGDSDAWVRVRAGGLMALAGLDWLAGDHAAGERHGTEGLELHRRLPEDGDRATAVNRMGLIRMLQGRVGEARDLFEEALHLYSRLGEERGIYTVTNNLGVTAISSGDYLQAAELSQRAADLSRRHGDVRSMARGLNNRGFALLYLGQSEPAKALAQESLAVRHEVGDPRGVAESLELLAGILIEERQCEHAAHMIGAAAKLRGDHDLSFGQDWLQGFVESLTARARRELGSDGYEAALAQGTLAPLDRTVGIALAGSRENLRAGPGSHEHSAPRLALS